MYDIIFETYLDIERKNQYDSIVNESMDDITNAIKVGWSALKKKISESINKFRVWIVQFFSKKVYMHTKASDALFENIDKLSSSLLNEYKNAISEGDLENVINIGNAIGEFCNDMMDDVFSTVDSDVESIPFGFNKIYSLYQSNRFDGFVDKILDINSIIKNLEPQLLFEGERMGGEDGKKIVQGVMSNVWSVMNNVFISIRSCIDKVKYKGRNNNQVNI